MKRGEKPTLPQNVEGATTARDIFEKCRKCKECGLTEGSHSIYRDLYNMQIRGFNFDTGRGGNPEDLI